jgi:hypothetical protein
MRRRELEITNVAMTDDGMVRHPVFKRLVSRAGSDAADRLMLMGGTR